MFLSRFHGLRCVRFSGRNLKENLKKMDPDFPVPGVAVLPDSAMDQPTPHLPWALERPVVSLSNQLLKQARTDLMP